MENCTKHQNYLKRLCTSLIIVHRYKQHGMTSRKAFYKKEGKVGFLNQARTAKTRAWFLEIDLVRALVCVCVSVCLCVCVSAPKGIINQWRDMV